MRGDVDRWCEEHLGSGVAEVRWVREGTGIVSGVELQDGRSVVVKAHRADYVPDGRAITQALTPSAAGGGNGTSFTQLGDVYKQLDAPYHSGRGDS